MLGSFSADKIIPAMVAILIEALEQGRTGSGAMICRRLLKTESKKILKLDEKLKAQKEIKELEKKRNTKRRTLFEALDEIDSRKEGLIDGVEARLSATDSRAGTIFNGSSSPRMGNGIVRLYSTTRRFS